MDAAIEINKNEQVEKKPKGRWRLVTVIIIQVVSVFWLLYAIGWGTFELIISGRGGFQP